LNNNATGVELLHRKDGFREVLNASVFLGSDGDPDLRFILFYSGTDR